MAIEFCHECEWCAPIPGDAHTAECRRHAPVPVTTEFELKAQCPNCEEGVHNGHHAYKFKYVAAFPLVCIHQRCCGEAKEPQQ